MIFSRPRRISPSIFLNFSRTCLAGHVDRDTRVATTRKLTAGGPNSNDNLVDRRDLLNRTPPTNHSYINMSNGHQGTTLCYVRPWNVDQLKFIAEHAFPKAKIEAISEHRLVDEVGLPRLYYQLLKRSTEELRSESWVTEHQQEDMIARCRLLRNLSKNQALKHLRAMAVAVERVLEKTKPQRVLSILIDSYLIDLIHKACQKHEIEFIGLMPTFVNGCFRITARGEPNVVSTSSKELVAKLRNDLLDPDYQPAFISKSVRKPMRTIYNNWARNNLRPLYFLARRVLSRDPYNYHYWSSQKVSQTMMRLIPARDFGQSDWEVRLAKDKRIPMFLPLQMYPECTVDYWCRQRDYVRYYETMLDVIDRYADDIIFLIKEHPNIVGHRPTGWYRKLHADKRILNIPTFIPSNFVLDKVNAVLVWTGTVGFEAALRGHAVLTLGDPYYASGKRFLQLTDKTSMESISKHVRACATSAATASEQEEMLLHLSKQLLKGTFKNDGTWSLANADDRADAQSMARSIRQMKLHEVIPDCATERN